MNTRNPVNSLASDATNRAGNPAILAGFEFEFLVAHNDEGWQGIDYHPDDTRFLSRPDTPVQTRSPKHRNGLTFIERTRSSPYSKLLEKVEDVIREHAGLVIYSSDDTDYIMPPGRDTILEVLFLNWIEPTRCVHPEFMVYSTGPDTSLHVMDKESAEWMDRRYKWRGCEVKSRVFTEEEITGTPTSSTNTVEHGDKDKSICLKEIARLCNALRANMRLQINHTCAMQVTLSHQQDGGYNLLSLKKILTLAWILEPMLFSLCAPHRRDGNNKYCRPIREYSELAQTDLNKTPKSILSNQDSRPSGPMEHQTGHISYWQRQFLYRVGAPTAEYLMQKAVSYATLSTSSGTHNNNQKENQNSNLAPQAGPGIGPTNQPGKSKGNNNKATRRSKLATSIERLNHHLRQIWLAPTAASLASMIQEHSYRQDGTSYHSQRIGVAVKFLGSSNPIATGIEFRMHEGTLDPVLSKMWLHVCLALVKKATSPPPRASGSHATGSSRQNQTASYGTPGGIVDTKSNDEIKDYAYMIRGFIEKMAGIESADDVYSGKGHYGYQPSDMLKDLGICEREIELWEKKIDCFSDPQAASLLPANYPQATEQTNQSPAPSSCADLPVDISCYVGGAYKDWAFLPLVCLDPDYEIDLEPGYDVFYTPPRIVQTSDERDPDVSDDDDDETESPGPETPMMMEEPEESEGQEDEL
ncbi:hypothetical protein V8F33_009640 [Rhypophila sp. PSN 637]